MALKFPRLDSVKDVSIQPLPYARILTWYLAHCSPVWLKWVSQPHSPASITQPCALPESTLSMAHYTYAFLLETHIRPPESAWQPGYQSKAESSQRLHKGGELPPVLVRVTLSWWALDPWNDLDPLGLIWACLCCSGDWRYNSHSPLAPIPYSVQCRCLREVCLFQLDLGCSGQGSGHGGDRVE